MKTKSLEEIFQELTQGLPKFDDGRVDYTTAKKAPVLSAVIYHDGDILLLKRSDQVLTHQGLWSGVTGFIDEPKSVEDFVFQELTEELALDPQVIRNVVVREPFESQDQLHDREWLVYPVLVELHSRPELKLDWEHTDFAWVNPNQLKDYDAVRGLEITIRKALGQ